MPDNPTTRPIADIERDLRGCSNAMRGHYALEMIQALRVREKHLLSVIRDYNQDDALFDHEKIVTNVE